MDFSAASMLCISGSLVVKTFALCGREVEDSQHSAQCTLTAIRSDEADR